MKLLISLLVYVLDIACQSARLLLMVRVYVSFVNDVHVHGIAANTPCQRIDVRDNYTFVHSKAIAQ